MYYINQQETYLKQQIIMNATIGKTIIEDTIGITMTSGLTVKCNNIVNKLDKE